MLIKVILIRTTMGVISCLGACCEIVSCIKWEIVRDIYLDIYSLIVERYDESDSRFEFLNRPVEVWVDPIEVFQQEPPNAKSRDFTFVIFMVWLHRNHPVVTHRYYKEITLKYPERCPSTSRLAEMLVSLYHAEQKASQRQSERD